MENDAYYESESILRKKITFFKDHLLNENSRVLKKHEDVDELTKLNNIERKKLLEEILL